MLQVYLAYFFVLFVTQAISTVATNAFVLLLIANKKVSFSPLLCLQACQYAYFLKLFNVIHCLA